VFEEVGKKFRQPAVIDERRKVHFVEEIMPRAPHLTREEETMLEGVGKLEKELHTKGKRVDAEVRGALVERMKEGVEFRKDQVKVFEELEELFGGEDEKGWRPLKSPYEGVKMETKNKQLLPRLSSQRYTRLFQNQVSFFLSPAACT
jgi:hypothetical protein